MEGGVPDVCAQGDLEGGTLSKTAWSASHCVLLMGAL